MRTEEHDDGDIIKCAWMDGDIKVMRDMIGDWSRSGCITDAGSLCAIRKREVGAPVHLKAFLI